MQPSPRLSVATRQLGAVPVHLRPLVPEHDGVSPLQHHEGSVQGLFAEALAFDHLPAQRRQTCAPADGQSPLQLRFDTVHLLVQLPTALVTALVYSVHGGAEEEADGLVDMLLCRDGRQRQLGQRLGDTDDGFKLTNRDGDRRTGVGVELGTVHLFSDGDEVRGEFFSSFGREARGTSTVY